MKVSLSATFVALSLCSTSVLAATLASRAACTTAVKLTGNAFSGRTLKAHSIYAAEVNAAVAALTDKSLATKAAKLASVGTFFWLDKISTIAKLDGLIKETSCTEILGIVIYDLPGRDCAAKASNGELAVGSLATYKAQYIDPIRKIIAANPNTALALIIEPDSLPNLVTNSNLTTCQQSADGYRQGVAYALQQLNLPNVVMYLDAGHGGWLGWDANLTPGAQELARAYTAAGKPAQLKGFSTNVAGWNAWIKVPGEFDVPPDGQFNKAQDENRYVNLFGAALATAGMPNHAVVDTGRNAVQGLRLAWGDWCNVNGAGFGVRPTSSTGNSLADAFVWVKPGGESDGTSNTSSVRFDSFCGLADAFQPAPEAGTWNQAYFEMLVRNAVPSF